MTQTRMQVTTTGFDETMRVLKQLDPELRKQTRRAIRQPLNQVRKEIANIYKGPPPMSGWRTVAAANGRTRGGAGWPAWTGMERNLKVEIGRSRKQLRREEWNIASIASRSAAAEIYEFADNVRSSSWPQARQFIVNLNRNGKPARAVWRRIDANRDQIEQSVSAAVRNAEAVVNQKLGRL